MNGIKITINNYPNTWVETSQWCILGKDDNQRVSVRNGKKEYSLAIYDNDDVILEIWSLDEDGELLDVERTIPLTTKNFHPFNLSA